MATVDTTGITPTTLADYIELLNAIFQTAFGANFNVDPDTPQGQMIGNLALSLSQSDDQHVVTAQALDIFKAFGNQLEGIATALTIEKRAESNTVVTAELAGVAATLIEAGKLAKTTAGDIFQCLSDITLDGSGNGTGTFQAIESGPIAVGINELTSVVSVVPGWETIDNSAAGSVGQDEELDSEYRARYFQELAKNAVTPLESVVAAVREVDTVTDVEGTENDSDSSVVVDGVTLVSHSIAIVVEGGSDAEIGAAIRLKKTGGTATNGPTTVLDPPNTAILFYRVSNIYIEVAVDITIDDNFPSNGIELMKQRIYDYILGTFSGAADSSFFESDGMTIGEDLARNRLFTPVLSVPGHVVNTLTLDILGVGGDQASISADLNEKITFFEIDDIAITST